MNSSYSATVRVDKATSDLLNGPDWTMNIDICDSINSNDWQGKDVMKALKKRLQHKNPKVQLLALTLLETMVKNCGDYVHFEITERNILNEMIKIVRKKTDMHVRDKILVLLDSWQEAFGGSGGKYPQYYWACEELRRTGVAFPRRSSDAAPIFTPPVSHPTTGYPRDLVMRNPQRDTSAGGYPRADLTSGYPRTVYGMPSNTSKRLDEAMASEIEVLSLSTLDSMRNVMDLLSDMLEAVNPSDRLAVKDELIIDIVSQCRSNQKKLMQMLTTTGDEELLSRGLDLNDSMQILLARYDGIVSGVPVHTRASSFRSQKTVVAANVLQDEGSSSSPRPNVNVIPSAPYDRNQFEEEEEDDDFAQLARRHNKARPVPSPTTISTPADPVPVPGNALALLDPPLPVKSTRDQDIIDLLSITLSTTSTSPPLTPHAPQTASAFQNLHQDPATKEYPSYASQPYPANEVQESYNSYVVPWALPQTQTQQQQTQPMYSQMQPQNSQQPQIQRQQQPQPQPQSGLRPQLPHYSSAYPPPPWATTPGYANNHQRSTSTSSTTGSVQEGRKLHSRNSFPARESSNGSAAINGKPSTPSNIEPGTGQKPFVLPYRLFEDLDVFGSTTDGARSSTSSNLCGPSGSGIGGVHK